MFSTRVQNLKPYIPGEQPGPQKNGEPYIKVNANENPYPPSPKVAEAIASFITSRPAALARYPDPDSTELRHAIACMNGVGTDMIFVGNGSDEVLSLVFAAFFDKTVVQTAHTYSFYPVYTGYYDLQRRIVPLAQDWTIDTAALAKACVPETSGDDGPASFIIANPNAPTGTYLDNRELSLLLQAAPADRIHVIDEAYTDFAPGNAVPLLAEFPNLAIVRTFSKGFSFAGMRLGYLIAAPSLIEAIKKVKNSFNHFPVDLLTAQGGIAACADEGWYRRNAAKITADREEFTAFLRQEGWEVLPSAANFVFARKPDGESGAYLDGKRIYEHCKKGGVLIRHFNTPGIENFVRITIGLPREMEVLRHLLHGERDF